MVFRARYHMGFNKFRSTRDLMIFDLSAAKTAKTDEFQSVTISWKVKPEH